MTIEGNLDIDREIEEEKFYIRIGQTLRLNSEDYPTKEEMKKAIFCKMSACYSAGYYTAKACDKQLEPYSFDSVLNLMDMAKDIYRKVKYVNCNGNETCEAVYKVFTHPYGFDVDEGESADEERSVYDFDYIRVAGEITGVVVSDDTEEIEILRRMEHRVKYIIDTGELCARAFDCGLNPYDLFESFDELEKGVKEAESEAFEKGECFKRYIDYCNQYFDIHYESYDRFVGLLKEEGKKGREHYEVPEKNRDDIEPEDVFGLSEMENLLIELSIIPEPEESPMSVVLQVLDYCDELDKVSAAALGHMIALVLNVSLTGVKSLADLMQNVYRKIHIEYITGFICAKALDMGIDPFEAETAKELVEIFEMKTDNDRRTLRYIEFTGIEDRRDCSEDISFGHTGRVAKIMGLDVTQFETENQALAAILAATPMHENTGSMFATAMDLGIDPYSEEYESSEDMKEKTDFFVKLNKTALSGEGKKKLSRFFRYLELEELLAEVMN